MPKTYDIKYDIIRIFALFFVLLIHVNAPLYHARSLFLSTSWMVANGFYAVSHFCVPCFVMLSGALLVRSTHNFSLPAYLKNRVLRIVPPLIFWNVAYWVLYTFVMPQPLAHPLCQALFGPGVSFHLWYLYAIVGVYLYLPFISFFYERVGLGGFSFFAGLWFATSSVLLSLHEVLRLDVSVLYNFSALQFSGAQGIMGYIFLGVIVRDLPKKPQAALWCLVAFLTLCLANFWLSYETAKAQGAFTEVWYTYNAPLVALSSPLIFYVMLYLGERTRKLTESYRKMIRLLADTSLGVYCIHIMFFEPFSTLVTHNYGAYGIPLMLLYTAALFAFSVAVCLLMKSLPGLKYVV